MGEKIGIWSLQSGDGGREAAVPLEELTNTETERRLENLLVESPDLLLPGVTLVGRQVPTDGGPLDLVGIDSSGRAVLFELKRGTLTRDAVAQILDYASDLAARTPDEFGRLIEQHSGRGGIEPITDFADWYQREFPDSTEEPPHEMRLVLVGLGVDPRAKRMVNYLAKTGLDIQLLTFQAFRAGAGVFLARKVETVEPSRSGGASAGSQKQQNRRQLFELAKEQGVDELLTEVADFIDSKLPSYRWPGKTAFTYSLAEQTEEGKPTQRAYATVWVDQKVKGKLLFSLPDRGIEAAPQAVDRIIEAVPTARRTSNSWTPFELPIDHGSWPGIQGPLGELLSAIAFGWKSKMERLNSAEDRESAEASAT